MRIARRQRLRMTADEYADDRRPEKRPEQGRPVRDRLHDFDRVLVEQVMEQVYQGLFELQRFDAKEFFDRGLDRLHDEAENQQRHDHGDQFIQGVEIEHGTSWGLATETERRRDRRDRRDREQERLRPSVSPSLRSLRSLRLSVSAPAVADFDLFEIQPKPRAFGMGFDLLQNLDGQGQRAAAIGPAYRGRGPRLNGGDERFDFGEQWLAFFDRQAFRRDFGQGPGGLRRDQFERRHLLFGVIERVIFVRLKDAQLAQPLAGDAAGGDVGDAAAREFQPGVGQIDLLRKYRDADRLDFDYVAFDQAGDDVQLVNHQIHHHVDVERARREDAHPVGLEKPRTFDAAPQRHERRVEPFDVAGLQDQILRFGRADHLVRFVERARNRLFDQRVDARLQKGA